MWLFKSNALLQYTDTSHKPFRLLEYISHMVRGAGGPKCTKQQVGRLWCSVFNVQNQEQTHRNGVKWEYDLKKNELKNWT